MSLVLLEHPDSPNCRKVRLLLAALDVRYESRRIELLRGETRTRAFLDINPCGQIPVLLDAGLALPESNAILLHLAARFAPIWAGRDEVERALVNRFLFWSSSGPTGRIATVGYERILAPRRGRETRHQLVAEQARAWRAESVVVEHWLRDRAFIVAAPSIADIALGAWLEIADALDMLADMPATRAWLNRLRRFHFWSLAGGYESLPFEASRPAQARIEPPEAKDNP